MGRLLAPLALLALALLACGCGLEGGADARDGATREGARTTTSQAADLGAAALDRALLAAERHLDEAGQPLLDCLDDPDCELWTAARDGARLASAVEGQVDALARAVADAPDGCARDAAAAAMRSLRTLQGVAGAAGEPEARQALTRAAEQAVDVTYALARCTPFRGAAATTFAASQVEVANAERRTRSRLARCTDLACRRREGAALLRTTTSAVAALRPEVRRLRGGCARDLAQVNLGRLGAYRRLGAAARRADRTALRAAADAIATQDRRFAAAFARCRPDAG